MAKAKALTEAELMIPTGTGKHARLLARYLLQPEVDQIAVLRRCVEEGSKKMRQAGWLEWAQLDAAGASRHAVGLAAGAEQLPKKAQREWAAALRLVGTAECLWRAEQLQGPVLPDELEPEALERAADWFHPSLEAARARSAQERWAEGFLRALDEPSPRVVAFARELLVEPGLSEWTVERLMRWLTQTVRDEVTLQRRDLPGPLLVIGARHLPAAEVYERLAPLVREGSLDPVALKGLAHDGRWVALVQSLPDEAKRRSGLLTLNCPEAVEPLLALAEGLPWDFPLKNILYALGHIGDPRALPLLRKWQQTPAGAAEPLFMSPLITRCELTSRGTS